MRRKSSGIRRRHHDSSDVFSGPRSDAPQRALQVARQSPWPTHERDPNAAGRTAL